MKQMDLTSNKNDYRIFKDVKLDTLWMYGYFLHTHIKYYGKYKKITVFTKKMRTILIKEYEI